MSQAAEKALVTGASGLLGQHLIRQLLQRGYGVRAFVRTVQHSVLFPEDVELAVGDIRNPQDVIAAVAGCEYVFHACCTHIYNLTPQEIWAINVEGTAHVCEAVKTAGCKKLVYTSATSTLSRTTNSMNFEYSCHDSSMPARQWSTMTKEVAEDLVLAQVSDGLPAVVVNPSYFVGPFDYKPSPFRLWVPLAIICKVRLVPQGGFNIVGAADVASSHVWALEQGKIGERYPVSGDNLTMIEFMSMVNNAVGRPGTPKMLPSCFLRLMAHGSVFDGYVAEKISRLNYVATNSPVPRQPLDQVIAETAQWFSRYSPLIHPWALTRYVRQHYTGRRVATQCGSGTSLTKASARSF